MSDNGMGGRRVGKKWHDNEESYVSPSNLLSQHQGRNLEEDTDYSTPLGHGRLSDWEQLISDYNRQNKFIRAQKRKWLPPRKRK